MWYQFSSYLLVRNSTIAENVRLAGANAGITCETDMFGPQVRNSIVWGNTGSVGITGMCLAYNTDFTGAATQSGNFSADPMFVSPGSDYRIQSSSPCRGVGDPGYADTTDYFGNPKPQGLHDIGAHEIP